MAQIVVSEPAEKDPGITRKAGALDLAGRCPSRGTICGDVACLPRPPQRTGDRCATPEKSACARAGAGPVEDMRRISVEMIPPREDRPGPVDRPMADQDPEHGRASCRERV